MPWGTKDSSRHTKKAKSAKRKRQWSKVANSILERTGDEGRAVRGANSAVKKAEKHKVSGKKGKARRKKSNRQHKGSHRRKISSKR